MRDDALPPDAIPRLREALEPIPEVVFAYLFGSAVTGGRHARSDVDLAVRLEPGAWKGEEEWGATGLDAPHGGASPRDRLRLWTAVHRAAAQALEGREVDLVVLNDAGPLLAERVVRTGTVTFSRDEARRVRWMAAVKSRYCDLRPLRERLDRTLAERVRTGRFGAPASGPGGASTAPAPGDAGGRDALGDAGGRDASGDIGGRDASGEADDG